MADLLHLWGKTVSGDPLAYHPVLYHMLDAGHVAGTLLGEGAPASWRAALARALCCDEEVARAAVPWYIAMHDLGKCSQGFQELVPAQKARLKALGVPFSARSMISLSHPVIGAAAWQALTDGPAGALPEPLSEALRQTVGGHHGRWLRAGQTSSVARELAYKEPRFWAEARRDVADWLWQRLPGSTPPFGAINLSVAIMSLTGFTILCDWLASDERRFPASPDVPPDEYVSLSRERALAAAEQLGFLQPTLSPSPTEFPRLFTNIEVPRPLQRAVDAVPTSVLREPVLVFIEAPTGEGKTEAALALAHRIGALRGSDALYYALPTMATSNQMFARLNDHLGERLRLSVRSRLVHGQAYLLQDDADPHPYRDEEEKGEPAMVSWFAPLKRALLAPFGVGTVDQAELAVLNVRHVALRCAGLAGKVVILDEVHAYDVYMTTIISRLLTWLRAVGASVIVLSATLPISRRRALLEAWEGKAVEPANEDAYPRLEAVSAGDRHVASPPAYQKQRPITLRWLDVGRGASTAEDAAQAKAAWLLEQLTGGGCACWITNTVAQAQDLLSALRQQAPDSLPLTLLHSRFPVAQREGLEGEIKTRYGPKSPERRSGIVVGTQVLEQSLDLDFDLMVSDLAPIDLLLQRAGRLHRHERPARPIAEPTLWVYAPTLPDGSADLGVDAVIYSEYVLRRTLRALAGREVLRLPDDYRPLIEAVYADGEPDDPALADSWQAYQSQTYTARMEAEQRLLPAPRAEEPFCTAAAELLFQEQEGSASWGVAQTRLGAESVTLVPLERRGGLAWQPSAGLTLPLNERCSREAALAILRHAIRVSHGGVLRALEREATPDMPLFKHPLLANVRPLWLTDGHASLGPHDDISLHLDPELGLVIDHAQKGDDA